MRFALFTIYICILLFLPQAGKLPYNQLPVLQVDEAMYAQSYAILNFAGKLSGSNTSASYIN